MYDVLMSQGDNVSESTGNYRKTTTSLGKMARVLLSAYGKWPAGPQKIGCETWVDSRKKASTADLEKIETEFKEALQPLVEYGLIKDVSIVRISSLREDSPRWQISAYDLMAQESVQFEISKSWGS